METPAEHVEATYETAMDDLFRLLAQPSISTTDEGVDECVELVMTLCDEYGFDTVDRIETDGQPSVLATATSAVPDAYEVLIYGHYDVQPVDPALWSSPPFEPTIRPGPDGKDRLYARGAGDNKGQWFAHLVAIEALRSTTGLPINISLLLEGEEESGSPHMSEVIDTIESRVDPDLIYVSDGPIDRTDRPTVTMGLRGILYVQLDVTGPNRDLHSGNFGGIAPNPAWALIELLSSMKDPTGRVTIDGYYDDVRPVTDSDRAVLAEVPFDPEGARLDIDAVALDVGPGETPLENLLYYPTLNVNGFTSGYGGEGMMTIIPSTAQAKIDMRLVADQDPDDIFEKFLTHIETHTSDSVSIEVTKLATMTPHRTPVDDPIVQPIVTAVREAWGTEPIVKPAVGGSLPTGALAEAFDAPFVSVPYANADENNHSPDENLALWCFENGVRTTVELVQTLANVTR